MRERDEQKEEIVEKFELIPEDQRYEGKHVVFGVFDNIRTARRRVF